MIQSGRIIHWKTCPNLECLYQVPYLKGANCGPVCRRTVWVDIEKTWDDENSWKMLNEQYSRNNLILEKSIKQQFVKNAHLHVKVSRYYLKERFIEPNDSFKWLILNDSYRKRVEHHVFNLIWLYVLIWSVQFGI